MTLLRGLAWLLVVFLGAVLFGAGQGASAEQVLRISGDVTELQLGGPGTLAVTIDNPTGADAVVSRLDVTVSGGTVACGPDALTVPAWTGTIDVPAGGAAELVLPLSVLADERCAGVSWDLDYVSS